MTVWELLHLLMILRDLGLDEADSSRTVAAGYYGLRRDKGNDEVQLLELVALGRTNRQIADHLGIESEETIKQRISSLFDKLGIANRLEAAKIAVQFGLVRRKLSRPPRKD